MALLAERIGMLGTENAFRLGPDIAQCVARGMDVIRLHIGEPDYDTPPHISAAATKQIDRGNSHYADPQGILSLRTAIASRIERARGIAMDPSRVVVTAGAKPSIGFTMQAYVDPGDEVIYPSPGFPMYESWISYLGATPVPLRLTEATGFTFTPSDIARLITPRTKVVVLCSPSNPTGGVLSGDELADVARVILERCGPNVRVLSDEIYEDIVFDGEMHRSIASEPGMTSQTIIASGHSKGYAMTGWRLGYVAMPSSAEAAVFTRLNINSISCVPPFIQEAGCVALESPASVDFIAQMVATFQERRDWIVPALNAIPGIRCRSPKGAFYVFPNVGGMVEQLGILDTYARLEAPARSRTSPSRMLQQFLLYRYGVSTLDRRSFGTIGSDGEHFLRLSIATSLDQIREGVGRIATATRDAAGWASFFREELSVL